MKHKGSTKDFMEQRNKELAAAFRLHMIECERIYMPEISKKAVNTACSRFWVSPTRAAIVLARMMKGDKLEDMMPTLRSMYEELLKRANVILQQQPDMPISEVSDIIVYQPADSFYIRPESAEVIYRNFRRANRRKRNC